MTVISLVKHTFHFHSLSDYNLRTLIDVKKKIFKKPDYVGRDFAVVIYEFFRFYT